MLGFEDYAHVASFLLVSAFSLWAVGALAAIVSGDKASDELFSTIFGVGSALLTIGVLTAWPIASTHQKLEWVARHPIYLGLATFANHIDALSVLFLLLVGVVGIAIAFFSPGYMHRLNERVDKGLYWFCLFLFVIGIAQTILAANALTFLFFWEIMSLSSAALVASDPLRHRVQRSALIYLGANRIATAFLAGGFVWLHYLTDSWSFADWNLTSIPMVPVLLIFIGFAIKAGCFPFHIWLPYAQAEAPSPISALMSGVMVKVAIYGMVRLLIINDCASLFIGYCALVVGVISAVWGVLFGLMEHDLKRLLAYSTVENVGLIVTGIGLALLCKCTAHPVIAAYALTGILFHVINHGLFKSLLFLGAGTVDAQAGSRDLSFLGGLAKSMPWTMTCFFVGAVAICALPPLNGFASKWLLYQSFFQLSFHADSIVDRGMALSVVGVLSVVGALSLATFAKAVGIGFLGRSRSEAAAVAVEATQGMVFAQMFLAVMCILLGVSAAFALHQFAPVCQDGLQYPIDPAVLFTIPQMLLVLLGLLTVFVVYSVVLGASRGLREYVTWDCGYGELPARAEETGSSFSQPIGRIFKSLLQYKVTTEIKGKDRRHFPDSIKVDVQMLPALEYYIYSPFIAGLQWFVKLLVKLQTASIHIHLLYVFMTMLILVCVGISL